MKQVYCNIQWDEKKQKKIANFGAKWGTLDKANANATAVKTGSGTVVVDIDTKNFKELDHKLMNMLGKPTIKTKRGYHYYFNVPNSKEFVTGTALFEHVDIRSEGGLVFNDYWGDDKNIAYETVGEAKDMSKKLSKYLIETYAEKRGGSTDKKKNKTVYNNTDKKKMKKIMKYIKCYDDYDEWYQVGMALKDWDDVDGLKLWNKWSKQSDAYEAGACESKWGTFDDKGDISVGSLYHLAEQNGYVIEHSPDHTKKKTRNKVALGKREITTVPDDGDVPLDEQASVDWDIINKVKAEVMRVKGGFELLNDNGKWIFVLQTELWMTIYKVFGNPFNLALLDNIESKIAELNAVVENEDGGITRKNKGDDSQLKTDKKKLENEFKSIRKNVTAHITTYNQYGEKYIEIDPFKTEDKVWVYGDTLHLSLHDMFPNVDINKPYGDSSTYLDDYRDHFAHFDEFLDFITASRFAPDRKKAYLYTKMISDFGKSFIGDVFSQLGLVAEINEKELKKAGTGDPVGLSASMFRTAWILFFDEIKYINSDFKAITSKMKLSPKGQARVTVPVYCKWLANAEGLDSLVNNTERQFANRFSFWDMGDKSLDERPLFRKSKSKYFIGLKWEVYQILKENIKEYVELGKADAYDVAQKRVEKFHKKYGLKESMEENMDELLDVMFERITNVVNSGKFKHEGIDKLIYNEFSMDDKKLYVKRLGSLDNIFTSLAKEQFGDDYKTFSFKKHYLRDSFKTRTSFRNRDDVICNGYFLKDR